MYKYLELTSGLAMADHGGVLKVGRENNDIFQNSFEIKVREKLVWTRKRWEKEKESDTRLHKLCNSMNFWSKKLKPAQKDFNVILTLYNEERDVRIALQELLDAVKDLKLDIKVVGYSEFRNPRYLTLYFENKDMRNLVEKNLTKVGDSNVVYLNWAYETSRIVKVHWLPLTVTLDKIKKELDKYFVFIEEYREEMQFMSGEKLDSGKVTFKTKVREGIDVKLIPHLHEIEEMECLITVQGRQPLCLNCYLLGHMSWECPTPHCKVCKTNMEKGHKCIKNGNKKVTYANIVNKNELKEDKEDWEGGFIFPNSAEELQGGRLGKSYQATEKSVKESGDLSLVPNSHLVKNYDVKNGTNKYNIENQIVSNSPSDSEEDLIDPAAIEKMENYIFEMEKLTKESSMVVKEGRIFMDTKGKGDQNAIQIDIGSLKRKIDTEGDIKNGNNQLVDSGKRTYSRKGKGGRNKKKVEGGLFNSPEEQREFVFQD